MIEKRTIYYEFTKGDKVAHGCIDVDIDSDIKEDFRNNEFILDVNRITEGLCAISGYEEVKKWRIE